MRGMQLKLHEHYQLLTIWAACYWIVLVVLVVLVVVEQWLKKVADPDWSNLAPGVQFEAHLVDVVEMGGVIAVGVCEHLGVEVYVVLVVEIVVIVSDYVELGGVLDDEINEMMDYEQDLEEDAEKDVVVYVELGTGLDVDVNEVMVVLIFLVHCLSFRTEH
jgi:hypothetical protein